MSNVQHLHSMKEFKDEYRELLVQFHRCIPFSKPECAAYPTVEKAVLDYFRAQGFSSHFIRPAYPAIKASCAIAVTAYAFVPAEVQEVIATYTTFAILIDDTTNVSIDDLRTFLARLCGGQVQPNLLLRDMLRFIADVIPRFYGPFASDIIRKAIVEFTSACVLETEYAGRIALAPTAPDFPYYLRQKTGMAEAYAFFAFPESLFPESVFMPVYLPVIPGLVRYINLANDLLSYYKESVVGGERFNYTVNYARTNDLTPVESLRETVSSLNACVANTRTTLADLDSMGSTDLHGAVTKFFSGYAVYHYSSARYQLSELEIPELEAAKVSTDVPFDVLAYIDGGSMFESPVRVEASQ
ncbi:isoprenoid synthase domain-containing protein [Aspergillus foveolatus]|uniref:isoprenoid synthase domain-containing protein n=1 Tax=Aspergillus foveolatus TaxID=210207 RepID=UPI003CCE3189